MAYEVWPFLKGLAYLPKTQNPPVAVGRFEFEGFAGFRQYVKLRN
jgi:hypothetical protein